MSVYDDKYSESVMSSIASAFDANVIRSSFSIDIEGGFNEPPILLQTRFVGAPDDLDMQEKIAKYCIKGKMVKILLDGELVGSPFQINGIDDSWDAIEVLKKNPLAFSLLLNNAASYVLKKYLPPSRPGVVTPAVAAVDLKTI